MNLFVILCLIIFVLVMILLSCSNNRNYYSKCVKKPRPPPVVIPPLPVDDGFTVSYDYIPGYDESLPDVDRLVVTITSTGLVDLTSLIEFSSIQITNLTPLDPISSVATRTFDETGAIVTPLTPTNPIIQTIVTLTSTTLVFNYDIGDALTFSQSGTFTDAGLTHSAPNFVLTIPDRSI